MQLTWRIADAVAPDAPLPGTQRGTRVTRRLRRRWRLFGLLGGRDSSSTAGRERARASARPSVARERRGSA